MHRKTLVILRNDHIENQDALFLEVVVDQTMKRFITLELILHALEVVDPDSLLKL